MENKQTLEYAYGLLQHIKMCIECKNEAQAIRLLEKYTFAIKEQMYSEEDLEVAYFEGKEGLYSFNDWLKQFKK